MGIARNFGTPLLVLVAMTGTAKAGLLTSDSAAYDGWQGTEPFSFLGILNADVDYAVYAPGHFHQSLALGYPTDPSGGTQYVYAYQILNNTGGSEAVSNLSVGLTGALPDDQGGDKQVSNIGWISPYGGEVQPSDGRTNGGPPPQDVIWDLNLPVPDLSSILIYTSPFPPEMDSATLQGGPSAQGTLPSPVPEPASGVLLCAAIAVLAAVRGYGFRG